LSFRLENSVIKIPVHVGPEFAKPGKLEQRLAASAQLRLALRRHHRSGRGGGGGGARGRNRDGEGRLHVARLQPVAEVLVEPGQHREHGGGGAQDGGGGIIIFKYEFNFKFLLRTLIIISNYKFILILLHS
jgi:hypothetical protein